MIFLQCLIISWLLCSSFVLPFTSCRSDPDDELENADFIGLNAYLHCDGTLTDYTNLPGFVQLLSDFQTYETTVPVMV